MSDPHLKRKQHLQDQLEEDYELLKELEDALRYEDDPVRSRRLQRQIQDLNDQIVQRRTELDKLVAQLAPHSEKTDGDREGQTDQTHLFRLSARTGAQNKDVSLPGRHRIELLDLFQSRYTLEQLQTLWFILEPEIPGMEYNSFSGEGTEGKARELIRLVEKSGNLNILLDAIQKRRPDLGTEISAIRKAWLEWTCQQTVRRLFHDEDWQLVDNIEQFIYAVFEKTMPILPESCSERRVSSAFEKMAKGMYYDVLSERLRSEEAHRLDRAFKELYNFLYETALYRVGAHEIAEEIAQEVLVKVWAGLDRTLDSKGFIAWTQMLVAKEVMRSLTSDSTSLPRSENVVFSTVLNDVIRLSPSLASTDPEEAALAEDFRSNMLEIIRRELKSEAQQKVIISTFLEGKGTEEIADELGTSMSNVYVLRSRALQQLRVSPEMDEFMHSWLS